ncbi:GPI mannosyltransferase 2 isoform X2 [Lingula anatina]|uniref:GPI mannosyltransferase 2 n=1 Tax=Lingula anatina TaxID=7574 RepID=A0A1S3J1P9_LINAN|nr:GPI mannosyltransferase 2 isoform X2 [Lingula anatina]|eukprot:XP_013403749.1 GPI mannosyltransferase 2 isoform X2 [Lingula anatina]
MLSGWPRSRDVSLCKNSRCSEMIFNYILPDHDAKVFNPPLPKSHAMPGDKVINFLLGGLRRWDGIYFLHIAEHGYTYMNCLAFFPLFPKVVEYLSKSLFFPLTFFMCQANVLLVTAVIVNLYCFVKSAGALYTLGGKVLNNEALAYKGALLYCINPASIFFTAPYSEAMFAWLGFTAMIQYEKKDNYKCSFFFGLASLVRSNGLVSACILFYKRFKDVLGVFLEFLPRSRFSSKSNSIILILSSLYFLLPTMLIYALICIAPFAYYQYYAYQMYCTDSGKSLSIPGFIYDYGRKQHYVLPTDTNPEWCTHFIPLSYSYIQSHHWGVGFMRYYQTKQLPNFVLALPMVLLCICAAFRYIRHNRFYSLTLGLLPELMYSKKLDKDKLKEEGFESMNCLVYMIHMLVLLVFGIFFMHIQVITRLLASSCPLIYWYAAAVTTANSSKYAMVNRWDVIKRNQQHTTQESGDLLQSNLLELVSTEIQNWQKNSAGHKLLLSYFMVYVLIGTAAFSNFLPWT